MEKFDLLMSRYQLSGLLPCKSIVLYTWLLPCSQCTDKIIKKLESHAKNLRVVLLYTSKEKESEERRQSRRSYVQLVWK